MNDLSFSALSVIFLISAVATCLAGISLTKTTTTLDSRFKLGDALGGLILLGIGGSLPELAVVISAAYVDHIAVIIGTLLGGIAFQTLIIVAFDFANGRKDALSFLVGSPMLVAETLFAIVITALAVFGTLIPARISLFNISPFSVLLLLAWIGGLFVINRLRKSEQSYETKSAAPTGRRHKERRASDHPKHADKKTGHVILIFLVGCLVTLIAGYFVEESGSIIAARIGMNSGLFAATIIALVTSLPEISTGLESVVMGDNYLAVSDIMGGNAFMLVLFLITDIIAKKPVLSFAEKDDIYFALLGIILMAVYAFSFWKKPDRCYFRLGLDSIAEIVIYAAGLILLTMAMQ